MDGDKKTIAELISEHIRLTAPLEDYTPDNRYLLNRLKERASLPAQDTDVQGE